ncbi:hypothetical protein [Microcoleus sp. CAWBG58]|nr:hypothetical protein [Microcoleus sp. CAWBG58]
MILKLLKCRTDDDLIHINITRLLDNIGDRASNGICTNSDFIKCIDVRC